MINLPGPDTTDWGTLYNSAINQLETMINAKTTEISSLQTLVSQLQAALSEIEMDTQHIDHNGTPLSDVVHNLEGSFNNPITPGTKTKITYDAKGFVTGGTNLTEGDIPALSISKIIGLEDIINMVLVDMDRVEISASIRNTNGGIRVSCFTNPPVPVQSWSVMLEWKGSIFYDVRSSSSESFINMGNYPEIPDGQLVNIMVAAISGTSIKKKDYSHTYNYVATSIDLRVKAVEHELAPQALMDRIAQDDNILNELVNKLQHSGTLVQRLSEVLAR